VPFVADAPVRYFLGSTPLAAYYKPAPTAIVPSAAVARLSILILEVPT
jgi:hypothetical protein